MCGREQECLEELAAQGKLVTVDGVDDLADGRLASL
jgi:hypothetical protein